VVGVPKEIHRNEKRVALSPENALELTKKGFKVLIEENAGIGSQFRDQDYSANGAQVVSAKEIFNQADIILKVRAPEVSIPKYIPISANILSIIRVLVSTKLKQ
jgi:alanine dehydrogenase